MKGYCFLIIVFLTSLFIVIGCVEPFSPPEVNSDEGYLVVDGFLNVGSEASRIELSHTQNTNSQMPVLKELGAKVTVEAETGEIYTFNDQGNGSYYLPPYAFNAKQKYRLRIKTVSGGEYLSDYVVVKNTPAIDAIEGKLDPRQDAMVMQVNTHDPTNQTRFYRWKFEETWEYRAAFYSGLERVGDQFVSRREDINLCWRTVQSSNILLGSTVKLSQDIIKDLPITAVPFSTNKLYIKYSILVKQYGLTQDAFEYWTSLAKTTEGTGGLFDPLPSQVTGNIKSINNPKELVFGYFSAGIEQQKRIFLTPQLGKYPTCNAPDTLSLKDALMSNAVLLSYFGERSEFILASSPYCADCRAQGGVTKRPSFWE